MVLIDNEKWIASKLAQHWTTGTTPQADKYGNNKLKTFE